MFIQCEHDVDISLKCEKCYKIVENLEDLFILIMSYLIFNNSFPYSFCYFYVFFQRLQEYYTFGVLIQHMQQ